MKKVEEVTLRRIKRLFIESKKEPPLAKRYIQLAKKIAMKKNLKVPKEYKRLYCHHCFSYFTPKNSIVRIKRENRKTIRRIYCLECKHYNRITLG